MFKGRTQKCSKVGTNLFLLFECMRKILDPLELEKWAVMAWAIWNARNKYYFEHVHHPWLIMEGASGLLKEYQRLMKT